MTPEQAALIRQAVDAILAPSIRDRVIWQLHDQGWPVARIARELDRELVRRQVSDDDIQGAGVSAENIRKVLKRPRPS